jgi:pentatricopeptide repeat protein
LRTAAAVGRADASSDDEEEEEEEGSPVAEKSAPLQALVAAHGAWVAAGADVRALSHSRAVRYVHMLRRTGRYDEAWALAQRLVHQDGFRLSLAFAAVLARLLRRSRNFAAGHAVYVAAQADPPVSILLRPLLRLALAPPVHRDTLLAALGVFRRMSHIRFLLPGDYDLMARALADKGYVAEAVDVWERMVERQFYADDYVALACDLVQLAFRAWEPDAGWRVYERARDNGIPLTTRALRTVIVLCLSDHNTDRALEVYTAMLARLYVRYNRAAPAPLRSRTAAELVAYLDDLAAARGPAAPSPSSWSTPSSTHVALATEAPREPPVPTRTRRGGRVILADDDGDGRGGAAGPSKPDLLYPVLYLMKIAASQGDPDLVQRMRARLPRWRLRPDKAHHAALVAAYAAAGELDQALAILERDAAPPGLGFHPTASLYSILIDEALRHGNLDVARTLALRATAGSPIPPSASATAADADAEGDAVAAGPTAFFYVRLIILYGRAGHADEAWRWYRAMRARGWFLQDARARRVLGMDRPLSTADEAAVA